MVWPLSWSVLQPQARVLAGQLLQAERHLLDAVLGLRLDRDVDHRDREGHALQHHRVLGGGQRVAGAGVLQAHEGGDVAGVHFLDLGPLVGVHLEHAADALAVVLGGVQHRVAALQRAGIDAHEGQRAVFVVDDLEREPGERRARVGRDDAALRVLVLAFLGGDLDAGHVDRARQVVEHRVEQRLHALVLERGAAQHRAERAADGAGLDAALQGRDVDVALVEILLHRRVIDARARCRAAVWRYSLRLLLQVGRDRLVVELGAQLAAFPDDRLHLDQVDDADELSSMPIGSCSGSATMSSFSFSVSNAR